MKLLVGELVVFLLVLLLAMLPDRITGRSALYRLACFFSDALVLVAALLPAIATILDDLPQRFWREWKRQHGLIGTIERERAEM